MNSVVLNDALVSVVRRSAAVSRTALDCESRAPTPGEIEVLMVRSSRDDELNRPASAASATADFRGPSGKTAVERANQGMARPNHPLPRLPRERNRRAEARAPARDPVVAIGYQVPTVF